MYTVRLKTILSLFSQSEGRAEEKTSEKYGKISYSALKQQCRVLLCVTPKQYPALLLQGKCVSTLQHSRTRKSFSKNGGHFDLSVKSGFKSTFLRSLRVADPNDCFLFSLTLQGFVVDVRPSTSTFKQTSMPLSAWMAEAKGQHERLQHKGLLFAWSETQKHLYIYHIPMYIYIGTNYKYNINIYVRSSQYRGNTGKQKEIVCKIKVANHTKKQIPFKNIKNIQK